MLTINEDIKTLASLIERKLLSGDKLRDEMQQLRMLLILQIRQAEVLRNGFPSSYLLLSAERSNAAALCKPASVPFGNNERRQLIFSRTKFQSAKALG